MDLLDAAIKILEKTYSKNLEILNAQNEDTLQNNIEYKKLYQSYWLSNQRLTNVMELLLSLSNEKTK